MYEKATGKLFLKNFIETHFIKELPTNEERNIVAILLKICKV